MVRSTRRIIRLRFFHGVKNDDDTHTISFNSVRKRLEEDIENIGASYM